MMRRGRALSLGLYQQPGVFPPEAGRLNTGISTVTIANHV